MVDICFYFQVHQPYRICSYSFFDIGQHSYYFDEHKNKTVLCKVAQKCYLPTNQLLYELIQKHPHFKVNFSFSGLVLDQFKEYCPQVLESFERLVHTGNVEILAETYYHSLAFLYSMQEFEEQVSLHNKKIYELFGVTPTIFRNTELVYHNDLAAKVHQMGYKGILAEGAEKILGWRSPNFIYKAASAPIPLLLKNYKLSDDIAFRFSDKGWSEYPLTVDKYCHWVNQTHGNGTNINIFMDYETFGEHQWESTGVFEFMRHLPGKILEHPDNRFNFLSEVVKKNRPVGELDVPYYVSWADIERDLSAWLGNEMQQEAIRCLYEMEEKVKKNADCSLLDVWRKLQTSDHFYYMCTKWFNDGDVHKYFNPYDSPYDAFIYFMNAVRDLKKQLADC